MITMMLSNSDLMIKLQSIQQIVLGFLRHGRPQVCKNRIEVINPALTYSSVCQTYPWQVVSEHSRTVAPQHSPLPFQFDEAKVIVFTIFCNYFVFFEQKVSNIQKIQLLLSKNCKVISGLNQNCKVLVGRSQKKCKVFLGRVTIYRFMWARKKRYTCTVCKSTRITKKFIRKNFPVE